MYEIKEIVPNIIHFRSFGNRLTICFQPTTIWLWVPIATNIRCKWKLPAEGNTKYKNKKNLEPIHKLIFVQDKHLA